jgi:type IV pilus assembly protein PilM
MGCESLTQALMNNRGIDREAAEQLRRTVGLTGESEQSHPDLTPETISEIHQVLDQTAEAIADEIRRSIDYYHTQEHDGTVGKLIVTGDGSLTANIDAFLTQALHLPVEIGNPLAEVGENKSKLSEAELEAMAPRLTIAIGLALDDEE